LSHIVVVADRDDQGVTRVVRQLEACGRSTSWLPLCHDDIGYCLNIDPQWLSLAADGFVLDDDSLCDARLMLFRRWRQRDVPPVISTLREPVHRAFAEREWSAAIDFLLLRIEREQARLQWAERPSTLSITRSRLALLDYAAAAGLAVPQWRIVTELSAVAGERSALVAKSVDRDERISEDHYFSTAVVDPMLLAQATGAPPTPTHLQLKLERICEYRVYHVFGTVLALAQRTHDPEVDIRHVEPANLDVCETTLPSGYAGAIRRFCDRLGLGMCAFDLIHERDRIWLVDVTPNGSWDHYETEANPWLSNRIASAIAAAAS
jgi:hypothetical protein